MIIEEKVGDIFDAPERYIAFATNTEGLNDAGFARAIFQKYSVLKERFPMQAPIEVGSYLVDLDENKTAVVLCAHTLGESWDHDKTRKAIASLKVLKDPIAIVKIGTGMVGMITNANWLKIRKMLEDSPCKFVIYSRR